MSETILNMLPLTEEEKAVFEAAAPDAVHLYAGRRTATPEQFAQATVILGWPRPNMVAQAAHLKWFHCMWAGTEEYVDVMPAGAALTSSAGTNSQSVSEHLLASLLALYRKLPLCRDRQREHKWDQDIGSVRTLVGATVLVAGAGHVGSAFAQLCKALGAKRTIGLKRSVNVPVPGFDELFPLSELDRLLPQADVVALTLPHTPETDGLMDRARLARMKEDAVLLSAGRGTVLDQDALVQVMGLNLAELFIVSDCQVSSAEPDAASTVGQGANFPGLTVEVSEARGDKCERCWMHSPTVGADADHPTLCARCAAVVRKLPQF